jgi:hypothetical protein
MLDNALTPTNNLQHNTLAPRSRAPQKRLASHNRWLIGIRLCQCGIKPEHPTYRSKVGPCTTVMMLLLELALA